jgi:hypothetical protein
LRQYRVEFKTLNFKEMKLLFQKKSKFVPQEKPLPSLAACIAMDLAGMASYAIPFLGEVIDLAWAPISAAIYLKMFGVKRGMLGGIFNFVEELLPGLDIIPTFTISWFLMYSKSRKENYSVTTSGNYRQHL